MNKITIKPGDKYGHWTVIGDAIREENGYHKKYLCKCDCEKGTERYVDCQNLKSGKSVSCGCIAIKVTRKHFYKHGESKTRLFHIWSNMKSRCYNQSDKRYKNWGGRGIKVCEEWKNSFETFANWAKENGYNDVLTIDRIDVNGNYEPSNCRWATSKEQANNRRNNHKVTYRGQTHNIAEWSEITGINRVVILSRLKKGYPLEDVFFYGEFDAHKRRKAWT